MRSHFRTLITLCTILTGYTLTAGCQSVQEATNENTAFTTSDDGEALTIFEGDQAVLSVLHGRIDPPEELTDMVEWDRELHGRSTPPENMDATFWRSNYIHPLYGLDGEKLTDDFPADHLHHRGIFWTWPDVTYGEKEVDPWALRGARQLFREWNGKEMGSDYAKISFESGWRLDEAWDPFVEEQISITVHPADETGRAIDFDLRFENVSSETVTLRGRGETGYGGFNIRPDGDRPGIRITTAEGLMDDDALLVDSGWADFSSRYTHPESGDEAYSGFAIFQNPENPDFPHPGWILRYYGFLGASWPQYERLRLEPGDDFQLTYRIYVHRGDAESASVADRFEEYVQEFSN